MPHEDFFIYVIDVAAGDKIPRKNGPGISLANILIISKTDVAPYVHASLEVMENDSRLMRGTSRSCSRTASPARVSPKS